MIPVERFNEGLYSWNTEFLAHFDSWLKAVEAGVEPLVWARFSMLEICRRARKTTTCINILIREACRHPKRSYVYIGPTFAEARRVVWDDPHMLDSHLPNKREMNWKKNEQKLMITFQNGSIIRLFGADDPDNIRGVDADGVVYDEWAMQKVEIWHEIMRPIIAQHPYRWAIFIYTPKGMNHATQMFDKAACIDKGYELPFGGKAEKCRKYWYASRLDGAADDGKVAGVYSKEDLAIAKEDMPEHFFDQEIRCARITEESMVLITTKILDNLTRKIIVPDTAKRIISCDPALGGDECVIKCFLDSHEIEQVVLRTRDSMRIVGELVVLMAKHHIYNFVIDTVGIGDGVAARLEEISQTDIRMKQIIRFDSRKGDNERFGNLRAAMWWRVMERCQATEIEYPSDPETRRQIPFASRHKPPTSTGKIQMLLKEIIKKENGCSPDRAEAWAMAIWALDMLDNEAAVDEFDYIEDKSGTELMFGAMRTY